MKPFAWIEPADLAAALREGAKPGALFKAGGIDLQDRLKEHLDEPEALVNLRRVKELDFVTAERAAVLVGPLVTLARLAADARLPAALRDAAAHAATPQIRNAATLGGNLAQRPRCWYFRREEFHCRRKGGAACFAIDGENEQHAVFDNERCAIVHPSATATALVALGATLKLRGPQGARSVAADQFFLLPEQDVTRENVLAPGELIVEVKVPLPKASAYVKLMQKQTFDWPLAEAAVAIAANGAVRVVLGAASPAPRRALEAEKLLSGKKIDAARAAQAAKAAVAGARPLEHNGHKVALLEVAVRRAVLAAGGVA